MIARPQPDEYTGYDAGYVRRVPDGADIFALLGQQPDELHKLLQSITDAQASTRPTPDEWSIKEVMGHINDTERVFAYRAMRIARGDSTVLPGFDQDLFVRNTNFNVRSLPDLIEEFRCHRSANLLCFKPLTDEEIARCGTTSTALVSVRALLFLMAGHVMHHVESLKVDFKIGV